jgi:hypothetical protein
MTRGEYLSAPGIGSRNFVKTRIALSFAFFFDPNFFAEVRAVEAGREVRDNKTERWDGASVHEFRGTYGEYLLGKVSKVFPELRQRLL